MTNRGPRMRHLATAPVVVLLLQLISVHGQDIYRGRQRFGARGDVGGPVFGSQQFGGQGLVDQGGFRDSGFGPGGRVDFLNSNLQLDSLVPRRSRDGGIHSGFRGSREPPHVQRILGSTVMGREMRMGERGLPRHGGAGAGERHANGLLRGWDGNPQTLGGQFHDQWADPLQGRPVPQLPLSFNGDFNSVSGLFGRGGIPQFRAHRW